MESLERKERELARQAEVEARRQQQRNEAEVKAAATKRTAVWHYEQQVKGYRKLASGFRRGPYEKTAAQVEGAENCDDGMWARRVEAELDKIEDLRGSWSF